MGTALGVAVLLGGCTDEGVTTNESAPNTLAAFSTNVIVFPATVNGAEWIPRYDAGSSVGTGVIRPFLDMQASPNEEGLNTDNDDFAYDQHRTSYTNKLPLNYVPVINVGGTYVREFVLDANESNSSPDPQFSIDAFDLYLCDDTNAPNYRLLAEVTGNSQCALVYDLGGDGPVLGADSTKGSGNVFDYRILIPEANFEAAATVLGTTLCPYVPTTDAEAACGKYLVLWNQMGFEGGDFITDATFEEYSTILRAYVTVEKTAQTYLTRTHDWDIEKSVDPTVLNLFPGESGDADYTVQVIYNGYADSEWAVDGTITITNPSKDDAVISSITDEISGVGAISVSCGVSLPHTLGRGDVLECTYASPLPDGTNRTNTVDVALEDAGMNQASASVDFSTVIINEVDESATITDTYGPATLGAATAPNTPSFTYSRTFTCNEDQGQHDNTATITADDSDTQHSDDASVQVNCGYLTVTKDAVATFTRTYNWTIDKSVEPATWDLFRGDDGTSEYTIEVHKTGYTDSDWAVTGTITVENDGGADAELSGVDDQIDGVGAATVSCPVSFPYTLAQGATLTTYSSDLPDGAQRTNTATASVSGDGSFSGEAEIIFGDPTTEVNASINVDDTHADGDFGPVSDDFTQTYSRTFTCDGDAGTHDNTATIVETGQSDDASVTVNCHALVVTKDASTSVTRTWSWTIDKVIDPTCFLPSGGYDDSATPPTATVQQNEQLDVCYDITIDATSVDSDWGVAGSINIANPNPTLAASLTGVADMVSPDIAATVSCPASSVPAGGSLECTYSAALPDGSTRTNDATATLQNHSYDSEGVGTPSGTTDFSGSASVSFDDPTLTEIDECVDVDDILYQASVQVGGTEDLGTYCAADGLPHTFDVTRHFPLEGDPLECGDNRYDNTATLVTNDTQTELTDDASINIYVDCVEGCTLTQGYWKTHNASFPGGASKKADPTWELLDADLDTFFDKELEPFFLSGQTWYEVFWTSPRGNQYYNLAHQYMAARLNVLAGADPSEVNSALASATTLFETYTPDEIAALKGNTGKELRAQFVELAGVLGSYNEGLIGPGHCTENSDTGS